MEISTSPHRPASTPWGRLVALMVILGPVTALVLLPIGLGLQRYVMSGDSMDGSRSGGISRGSIVFERPVPVDDLRAGDVITYRAPESSGVDGMVTHRIVSVGPDGIVTQGDASAAPDPWLVRPDGVVVPRVVFALPWIGYAYLVLADPVTWLLVLGSGGVLCLIVASGRHTRRESVTSGAVGAVNER